MTDDRRYIGLIAFLGLAAGTAFVVSLSVGPAKIGWLAGLSAFFSHDGDGTLRIIMTEIRLPRALLGLLVGGSLGLSGAVLQGYLRNPLAEPGILGVSSLASLGAVISIYSGLSAAFPLSLPTLAFAGALAAVVLLRIIAGRKARATTVLLAGVAVASFGGAMTAAALSFSPNPFAVSEIVFWLLGSLSDRSMIHVAIAAPFTIIGWLMLLSLGRSLDALTLGEDSAASLGVSVARVQVLAVLGTALCVGAATAVAGAIGFVGLIVPHLLRSAVGALPSRLLFPSLLGGATLLSSADILTRIIAPNRDLKLGVLTALLGAPFFLFLISRMRERE